MVHNLKSISDGGILDPDDLLVDVADDREQVLTRHYVLGYGYSCCRITICY